MLISYFSERSGKSGIPAVAQSARRARWLLDRPSDLRRPLVRMCSFMSLFDRFGASRSSTSVRMVPAISDFTRYSSAPAIKAERAVSWVLSPESMHIMPSYFFSRRRHAKEIPLRSW